MKKSMIVDPRLTKAEAMLSEARRAVVNVADAGTKDAVEQIVQAVDSLRAVLRDWEADENGWTRPSEGD